MMEERKVRLIINKPGGTAGKNSLTYKISLPSKWIKAMQLSADERNVVISFDGEKIAIRKALKETETE